MRRILRERGMVGGFAAGAVGIPLLLLWPAPPELHEQPGDVSIPIPHVRPLPSGDAANEAAFFSLSRTQEEKPIANVAEAITNKAEPLSPPPSLSGIAVGRSGGVALVKTAAGATIQVRTGEDVEGWRVAQIARDHIVIARGGETVEVGLNFKTARGAGPANPANAPESATSPSAASPEGPK